MILQTLGLFLIYCLLIWLPFYPLGYLLISKNIRDLEGHEVIGLSFAASIVIFVLLSILLSAANVHFLLFFVVAGLNLFSIVKFRKKLLRPWMSLSKNFILLGLVFLGVLVQGFINFPSGYLYNNGLLFWSSQGFDGFWHISLMNAIGTGFPPKILLLSGQYLQNYHYFSDVVMGEFNRVYGFFSPLDLYFRFFSVFLSFLMGISVYSFMSRWKNKVVGYWSVFFTYFVGSFGFVVTYLKAGKIFGGETAFWASQLNTVISNPPHASAIILLCSFLLSFIFYTKSKSRTWFLLSFLIGSVVAGFKVSGGVVLLAGLGAVSVFQVFTEKKFSYAFLFLVILATNIITIKLISTDVGSFLIFEPWWFIRTMVVVKLDLLDWELRRQTYLSVGRFTSYLRVLQLEGTALLIFIFGNLGMRVVGLPVILGKLKNIKDNIIKSPVDTFILAVALAGFVIPMLFLQKGIVYNSIQFMQYVLLITGFYGAIFTESFLKKIKIPVLKYLFVLILITFSVPTVIGNFVEFYGSPANAVVSKSEISALNFLKAKSLPNDIILTPPFNSNAKYAYKKNPLPIYAWSGTAYVSSLTDRITYLSNEEQLRITGYTIDARLEEENKFFSQKDFNFNRTFLKERKIAYLYIPDPVQYSLKEEANGLTKIFSNDEVSIYKVNN